jgi:hypothetical protein
VSIPECSYGIDSNGHFVTPGSLNSGPSVLGQKSPKIGLRNSNGAPKGVGNKPPTFDPAPDSPRRNAKQFRDFGYREELNVRVPSAVA